MYLVKNVSDTISPDIFFFSKKESENLLKSFQKIKVLNFEFGTRFRDNHHVRLFLIRFSLNINFLSANFLIDCRYRTTIRYRSEQKCNNVSLY